MTPEDVSADVGAGLVALYLEAQPELDRLIGGILAGPDDEVAEALRSCYVSKTGSASARIPAVTDSQAEVVEHVRRGEVGMIAPASADAGGEKPAREEDSSSAANPAQQQQPEPAEQAVTTGRLRMYVAPFALHHEGADDDDNNAGGDAAGAFLRLAGELLAEHLMRIPALDVRLARVGTSAHDQAATLEAARAQEAAVALTGSVRRDTTEAGEPCLTVTWTLHLLAVADQDASAATQEQPEPREVGTESWTYTLAEVEGWLSNRTAPAPVLTQSQASTTVVDAAPALHPAVQMALPALRVLRRLGVPCEPADLERLALPVTLSPQALVHWAKAREAEAAGSLRSAWQYYTLALEAEPGLKAAQVGLRQLVDALPEPEAAELPEEVRSALDAYPSALAAFTPYRAVVRHADPSLWPWLSDASPAQRDDFSAVAFAEQAHVMGQGLDMLLERLLELHAYGTLAGLATNLLESHVGREDTPLPATFAQWQMPLQHPGNRVLLDREQRRAFLNLCLARAELGLGRWEDAVARADYISRRFPHVPEIKSYAEAFASELSQYDAQAFRRHQFESQQQYGQVRPHLERAYVEGGFVRVARMSPANRVRAWAAQRPEMSWEAYGMRWEAFNRLARQRVPRPFPLEPDAAELERLRRVATELDRAATPTSRRLAYRPLSLLGEAVRDELRTHWQAAPREPGPYGLLLSGLVRAGEAPSAEAFAELVGSDPLTAARIVRTLTPALTPRSLRGDEVEALLDTPERRAAKLQCERIPSEWRPALWLCLEALPATARTEAEHLVAFLAAKPEAEEEERFLAAYPRAPEASAAALLTLGSTGFEQNRGVPRELGGFCLHWRCAFRTGGVAALVELEPEEPEWMMALGRALADMMPAKLLAPTRLANEVAKHRSERGLAERDMLHIEELASGALAADTRGQSAKVAVLILEQILKRWPPFELSPGDHIWMFGTIERLGRAEDEKAGAVALELATRSVELLSEQEHLDFGERDLTRERYYTYEQTLLVELLRRLVVTLDGHRSDEARNLLASMIRDVPLPAQGNLIPLVEAALAGYGEAVLPTLEEWLRKPDPFVVGAAHRILERLQPTATDATLATWLADEHPVVRHAAYETLRRRGAAAAPLLRSLLARTEAPSVVVQAAALELMARLPADGQASVEPKQLAQVLATTTARPVLRAACRVAAVHAVSEAFAPVATRLASWPFDDRLELLEAAVRTGELQAAPFLIRALKSRSAEEREFAYRHLLRLTGQLLEPEISAWTAWWMQASAHITLPEVFRTKLAAEPAGEDAAAARPQDQRALTTPLPAQYRMRVRQAAASYDAVATPPQQETRPRADAAQVPKQQAPAQPTTQSAAATGPAMPEIQELDEDLLLDSVGGELGSDEADVPDLTSSSATSASPPPQPSVEEPEDEEGELAELADEVELDELDEIAGEFDELEVESAPVDDAAADVADAPQPQPQHSPAESGAPLDPELAQLAGLTDAELADLVSLGSGDDFATGGTGAFGDISKSLPQMPVLEMSDHGAESEPSGSLPDFATTSSVAAEPVDVAADSVFDAFAGMDPTFDGFDDFSVEPAPSDDVPLLQADEDGDLPAEAEGTVIIQAPTDQVLLASPSNEVSGTFALGSLHGNGLGRWVDTNPDRFAADDSSWFLAGDPAMTHYQVVITFYIVAGSFEVVLGPDPFTPLCRVYLDGNEYAPGAWWTLMLERHGDSVKMRIAERDDEWLHLPGGTCSNPLAAMGLHFFPGADIAFGDLILESQTSRRR